MKIIPIWNETYDVGAYDTDFEGKIKLSSLTGYMQEAAGHHAGHLGLGVDYMHKEGVVWMLMAIKIHIERYPKWMEKIKIETWPRGMERLFYERDFILNDEKNEVIGWATSQWLLVDIKSKRPKIPETEELKYARNPDKKVFEEGIRKLHGIDIKKAGKRKQVIYSTDYDINRHVNSNRYIDFILNSFPIEYLKENFPTDFQINFQKEIKGIPEISIIYQQVSDNKTYLFEGLSDKGKTKHFQSFIAFLSF